jgi:hypothetical protein
MSEQMPQDSHEISDSQHEMINRLLYKINFTRVGDEDDLFFAFESVEYTELASMYGYENVLVGTQDDSMVVQRVFEESDGKQRTDTYVYCPEDRSLILHTVTEYDNEFIDFLNDQLDALTTQANSHIHASNEVHAALIEGLRNMDEYSDVFARYDAANDEIADQRKNMTKVKRKKKLRYKLSLREVENEVSIIDLFEELAAKDIVMADQLQRYRQPLQIARTIEAEMSGLVAQINTEQTKYAPVCAGKPDDFIALLYMVGNLEKDSA